MASGISNKRIIQKKYSLKRTEQGTPAELTWLSILLLVWVPVIISGLWDGALCEVLCLAGSVLAPLPLPLLMCSLSL